MLENIGGAIGAYRQEEGNRAVVEAAQRRAGGVDRGDQLDRGDQAENNRQFEVFECQFEKIENWRQALILFILSLLSMHTIPEIPSSLNILCFIVISTMQKDSSKPSKRQMKREKQKQKQKEKKEESDSDGSQEYDDFNMNQLQEQAEQG